MTIHAQILDLAKSEDLDEALNSYSEEYVKVCYNTLGNDLMRTWTALKQSYRVYEKFKQLEMKMDKKLFIDILKSTGTMVSGRDKLGRPIVWTRTFQGVYRLKANSEQEISCIRAAIYLTELGLLKAFPKSEFILVVDDSQRKLLDFNFHAMKEMTTISLAHHPAGNNIVYVFGVHPVFRTSWTLLNEVLGSNQSRIHYLVHRDDIFDIIDDRKQAPSWWFNDGTGKLFAFCRNNLWEWERCLSRGSRSIVAKDIFNPLEPWVDTTEDVATSTISSEYKRLEDVIDDSEDDVSFH